MVQRDTLESLRAELKPYGATLVAVSKTKPVADIRDAFELGLRDFGENYVQELAAKQEALPGDIRWHFIGHLQRNKVRTVAPLVHLVQSVDSPRLAHELHKQGVKLGRPVPGLLQVHIATEASKFGFGIAEAEAWVAEGAPATLDHLEVRGLMGMASFTDNTAQVRDEFRSLKNLFDRLAPSFARPGGDNPFTVLSMGMTGDYRIALDEGSNMVRIGSAIFGARK